MGEGLGLFAGMQAQIGEGLRTGAVEARDTAERIIARLDVIAEGILKLDNPESERAFETARVAPGESKRLEGRQGYITTVEHVSIVTDGATIVDIHVGTEGDEGFRSRLETAAAGKTSTGAIVGYKVPEGGSVFARHGGGVGTARVNIQLKREKLG